MTWGHIALLITGIIGLVESAWGLTAPAKLRAAVERVAKETPDRNPGLGLFFAGVAVVLWLLMSPDRRPSDWALMLLSWILAGGAYVNFRNRGFHDLVGFLILNRSDGGIRLLYAVELVLASTLVAMALLRL
jgi:hypothetical protein